LSKEFVYRPATNSNLSGDHLELMKCVENGWKTKFLFINYYSF